MANSLIMGISTPQTMTQNSIIVSLFKTLKKDKYFHSNRLISSVFIQNLSLILCLCVGVRYREIPLSLAIQILGLYHPNIPNVDMEDKLNQI